MYFFLISEGVVCLVPFFKGIRLCLFSTEGKDTFTYADCQCYRLQNYGSFEHA